MPHCSKCGQPVLVVLCDECKREAKAEAQKRPSIPRPRSCRKCNAVWQSWKLKPECIGCLEAKGIEVESGQGVGGK